MDRACRHTRVNKNRDRLVPEPAPQPIEQLSFEKALAELETIVQRLEQGKVELAECADGKIDRVADRDRIGSVRLASDCCAARSLD